MTTPATECRVGDVELRQGQVNGTQSILRIIDRLPSGNRPSFFAAALADRWECIREPEATAKAIASGRFFKNADLVQARRERRRLTNNDALQ